MAILHDEVTSVAPVVDHQGDATTDPSGAREHALEDKASIRPGVRFVLREDVRDTVAIRLVSGDVQVQRRIRGRRLADPERSFHPGPRFQVDDPG